LTRLPEEDRQQAQAVREMFARIAGRYDLMNRLMTGWQDVRWRREVIRMAQLPKEGRLLDLGAGTGDLAFEAQRQFPNLSADAADFTLEMMRVGRSRNPQPAHLLEWIQADALNLPFEADTYDAVVSGFLMRNVTDLRRAIAEQLRVLKPGGRLVILDTTRPRPSPLSPVIRLHLRFVIPLLGSLLTGDLAAYRYLPNTTEGFLSAEQLAERMQAAGLKRVGFKLVLFGAAAIHWGIKEPTRQFN
jgi:demethylmenaquinone methyltransferase / 2-methoxy-6-polyprenyl-1,4-benzoquinol methylase